MRLREKFDPSRTYEANKPFKWGKTKFAEGDQFPTPAVTCSDRKVRQMYEARFIRMRALDELKLQEMITPPAIPTMPDFERLSAEAIRNWLLNHCKLSEADTAAINGQENFDHLVSIAKASWHNLHNIPREIKPDVFVTVGEPDGGFGRPAVETTEPAKEETNGVATADGDSEHSGASVQRGPDDGDVETRDAYKPGQQRRSGRRNRNHVQRSGHSG